MKKDKKAEIKGMTSKELVKRLEEIAKELIKWNAGQHAPKREGGMIKLPTGSLKGVRWGLFKELKKEKAFILLLLSQRGIKC